MELDNLKKANEIMAEIDRLEKEIDFLLSYSNKNYFLKVVRERHIFNIQLDFTERKLTLGNEEINTITREKCKRVQKLKEKLESL